MDNLIFCTGFKGGVGKSFLAMTMADYFHKKQKKIMMVETDGTNPDVYKTFDQKLPVVALDLDSEEGWSTLFTVCHENVDSIIIVNSAARADRGFAQNVDTLACASEALQRQVISFFMLNAERDSMDLLCDFVDASKAIKEHKIVVVKNGYFGGEESFGMFDNSKVKKTIEMSGGASLYLAALPSIVRQKIKIDRLTLEEAQQKLPFGDKMFLEAWIKKTHKMLDSVL